MGSVVPHSGHDSPEGSSKRDRGFLPAKVGVPHNGRNDLGHETLESAAVQSQVGENAAVQTSRRDDESGQADDESRQTDDIDDDSGQSRRRNVEEEVREPAVTGETANH